MSAYIEKHCPMKSKPGARVACAESCAWYDQAEDECAVLAISRHLNDITYRLADLNPDGMTVEEEWTIEADVEED